MSGGFEELGLMPELLRAVHDLGWLLPTDIQDEAIPLIMGGGDVMAAAETGSGKTAAFCLPIIQCVHERLKNVVYNDQPKSTTVKDVRLNSNDKDSVLTVDEACLQCQSTTANAWAGARATFGVSGGGKHFFECTIIGNGICRVGWSTMSAHLELGKDAHGFGYGGKGFTSNSGAYDKYGEEYGPGDVVGCFLDLDERSVSYSKNGHLLGRAYALTDGVIGTVMFPAVLVQNAGMTLNFGATPFRFPPAVPGYLAVGDPANAAHLFGADSKEAFTTVGKRRPMAVIIEPTRDLAEQVHCTIADLTRHVVDPVLQSALLIGDDQRGGGGGKAEKALERGVDIVVGTMGKVQALLKGGQLDLSGVRFFVLDEADKLLSGDSLGAVMQVFGHCPGGGSGQNRLQVCFFSATLHSPAIKELAERVCVNPTWVDLKGCEAVPEAVHHVVYRVDPVRDAAFKDAAPHVAITDEVHTAGDLSDPRCAASQGLKEIKPLVLLRLLDKLQMSQCLVFCRTNLDCTNLETFFNRFGGGKKFSGATEGGKENPYSCCVLAGMRSMDERRANLQAFKDGLTRILICTDVAARGIDIEGLPFVVNMTLPDEAEDYVHRVGRVGRAERMGLAISIVAGSGSGDQNGSGGEKVWYHTCSSKGRSCANRTDKEEGGCTTWLDEPLQLAKVEKRLHQRIAVMGPDLELPVELAVQNVRYGVDSKAEEIEHSPHFAQLGDTVRDLAEMERKAQNMFLLLGSRFAHLPTNSS